MPAKDATPSRRIVLSGLGAEAPTSEMAISFVDKRGRTLNRASVNADGSCELCEEALASADGVLLEPAQAALEADAFRRLIETDILDVTPLLARWCPPKPSRDPGPRGR